MELTLFTPTKYSHGTQQAGWKHENCFNSKSGQIDHEQRTHPWKLTAADPKTRQIENEKHLQNLPFWVPWCSMFTIWYSFCIAWMALQDFNHFQSTNLKSCQGCLNDELSKVTDRLIRIQYEIHRLHSLWDKVIYCLSPTYETTSWNVSLGCLQKITPPKSGVFWLGPGAPGIPF